MFKNNMISIQSVNSVNSVNSVKDNLTNENSTVYDKHNKKKKTRYFEIYISKVLKQVSNYNNGITSNAKQQLNSAIYIITQYITSIIFDLTKVSNKKTISHKEVSNAISIIFTGDLKKNSIHEGIKSINTFIEENKNKTISGSSRQDKAGIIFPPSIFEKFLRDFGNIKIMVTQKAPIFFAAVLEYLVAEILLLAYRSANTNKRIRITIRDLELSVGSDIELKNLFTKLHISFIGGGVIPYIHPILSKKKHVKKKISSKIQTESMSINNKNLQKSHRFRPGTVALREIKKLQKTSNCLIISRFPFSRLIRNIVNNHNKDMKISKDVFTIVQYCVEQYIIDILRDANNIAIHSGHVKLMKNDIKMLCTLKNIPTTGFENIKPQYMSPISISEEIIVDESIDVIHDNLSYIHSEELKNQELSDISECDGLVEEY